MKYDTAIIGAGPAGLFCAYELSKNTDLKILLIDAGPRFEQKHCYYLSTGICTHCKVCCNLSGFGGAAFFLTQESFHCFQQEADCLTLQVRKKNANGIISELLTS